MSDFIGFAIGGIISTLYGIGAAPFTRCDQCRSPNACAQVSRCGILDIQQRSNEQMRAYWQSNDPNTFDLPPDAVREVRDVPLLQQKYSREPLSMGSHSGLGSASPEHGEREKPALGKRETLLCGFADSDGGECD